MDLFNGDLPSKIVIAVVSGIIVSLIKKKIANVQISLGGIWAIVFILLLLLGYGEFAAYWMFGGLIFSFFNASGKEKDSDS